MGTGLVILFLLAVCGLIAYTGDLLGRRMGRRRLSVFGLRPKHTAILFTVVTGVLIAGVTLGAAFAVSPGVRLALTHGERLVLRNAALRDGIHRLQSDRRELERSFEETQAEIRSLHARESTLRSENDRLERQTGSLQARYRAIGTAVRALSEQNRQLDRQAGRLRAEKDRLARERGTLLADNRALAGQRRTLRSRLARARDEVSQAQAQLKTLRDAADTQRETARRLATEELVFSEGEEIARRIVPQFPPAEVVRTQLETLLYEVRHHAAERQGRPAAALRQAAYLAPLQLVGPGGQPLTLREEEEIIAALTRLYARTPESLLLRAVSMENCLAHVPVPVTIRAHRNRVVLRQGEEIASQRLDGRLPEGAVLERLVAFLQGDVRRRALRELAMIPGPSGEVGEMRFEPLLEVARKVRQVGGWARVGAVARQDTWTGGGLHVDFYVIPDGESPRAR